MNKRKTRNVLIAIVFIAIVIPVAISYASKRYGFREGDIPKVYVEVPESWGKPVSIARRAASVTILFEGGHIITVSHGLLGIRSGATYTVQIIYTK